MAVLSSPRGLPADAKGNKGANGGKEAVKQPPSSGKKKAAASAPSASNGIFAVVVQAFYWLLTKVTFIGEKLMCMLNSQQNKPLDGQRNGPPSKSKRRTQPPVSGTSSRAGSKKGSAQAAGPAAAEPVYIEKDVPETETEKRIRTLKKKLRSIEAAEERLESGRALPDPALAEKIASKPDIERQIEELKKLAAVEAVEAAKLAAAEAEAAAAKAAAAEAAAQRAFEQKAKADAALAKARREALEVLPNVNPRGEGAESDSRIQGLLKQVAGLSQEVFGEDCLAGVSKKSGWKLSLLARPPIEDPLNRPPEDPEVLLGFIVYRLRPDMQCLSIAKIAVPAIHRGKGFGRHLMDWSTKYAKQQSNLQYLSLSSLPEAVKFYQAFGFKTVPVSAVRDDDEDLIEGQVYMEYRLKGKK
eukprot:TRINITY_DN12767_c0_g2_i1.p1 TRINITY_DN12767_c0_g2~~TRINITY_DN12767_c0_g2_i1.p1  ORF type:complete len:414 (-),score=127.98 TRINITY_DN12767_c0_g2_i1:372-1613(-)